MPTFAPTCEQIAGAQAVLEKKQLRVVGKKMRVYG
jgi:hypothetical protein